MVFFYDFILKRTVSNFGITANQQSTLMLQGINEAIFGLKEIRVLGKEEYFYDEVYESSRAAAEVSVKSNFISAIPRYLVELILVSFIILLVLSYLVFELPFSSLIPILSMFGVAAIRLAPSANFIVSAITQIRFGRNGVRILYDDLTRSIIP